LSLARTNSTSGSPEDPWSPLPISAIILRLDRICLSLIVALALSAQSGAPLEHFSATAFSRADSQVRTFVEIDIQRWSPETESDQLAEVFRRSGVEAALQELKRFPPAGQLRSISGLSRVIRFARETRFIGGARYFLLLVDPFTSIELFQGAHASGSDLSAISIWIGQAGAGEGQITAGAQIGVDAFGAVTVDVRNPLIVLPSVDRETR
jgi:hypothetical protein